MNDSTLPHLLAAARRLEAAMVGIGRQMHGLRARLEQLEREAALVHAGAAYLASLPGQRPR